MNMKKEYRRELRILDIQERDITRQSKKALVECGRAMDGIIARLRRLDKQGIAERARIAKRRDILEGRLA